MEQKVTSEAVKGRNMLDVLTSFRFFAALMVFAWHVHIFSGALDKFELGYAGVGFFYMLSGFILTYVYFKKISGWNIKAIKKFYIARLAKIYPVHILTFLAAIPLLLSSANTLFPEYTKLHIIGSALANATLLQAFSPDNRIHFSFNGVAWSISVEMFFYALFPLIIFALSRYYRWLTIKRLTAIIGCLWILLIVIYLPYQSHIDDWRFYIFPLVRLPDFIVGIFLGMIFAKFQQSTILRSFFERRNSTRLEIASLALLCAGILLSPLAPQSIRFSLWLMPFWAIVIFIFAHQKGYVSKILSNRSLVFLGEISFSFYMIHQLIIRYVALAPLSDTLAIAVSLAVSVTLSVVIYRFYEEPLRVKLKNILESKFVSNEKILPVKSILQPSETIDLA